MLDLKRIQKQPEILAKALADRHSDLTIETFQEIDAVRRKNIAQVEELKSRRNAASQEVARMKREGQRTPLPFWPNFPMCQTASRNLMPRPTRQ